MWPESCQISKQLLINMLKILLALLLIVPIILQTITITESGASTKLTSQTQISSPQSFFENSSPSSIQGLNQSSLAPSTWSFLSDSSLGGLAKWVTPKKSQQVYAMGQSATYTFSLNVDCIQQPVAMRIAATGVYKFSLNGNPINSFLGVPYPNVRTVTFSANSFKCGTNNISVSILNYKFESPLALIYTLTQQSSGCYECYDSWGYSVFNNNTCSCQCKGPSTCSNPLQQWLAFPFCRCECAQPPCPAGYIKDPSSCQCLKSCQTASACTTEQLWSPYLCKCVSKCGDIPTSCAGNQTWDPVACKCSCQETSCPGNQIFNKKICGCECPYGSIVCRGKTIWSLTGCQCQCPALSCSVGYQVDQSTCECVISRSAEVLRPLGLATIANP